MCCTLSGWPARNTTISLAARIERLYNLQTTSYGSEYTTLFRSLKAKLNSGTVRAAEPAPGESISGWKVNPWVKMGILLGFRIGVLQDMSVGSAKSKLPFFDKSTYPLKRLQAKNGVRVVPGGSSVRDGAYLGKNVVCMPPMYVNVGAYVDDGTMVDSHALVGSCAQIGKRVHLSAASQIGGVLE